MTSWDGPAVLVLETSTGGGHTVERFGFCSPEHAVEWAVERAYPYTFQMPRRSLPAFPGGTRRAWVRKGYHGAGRGLCAHCGLDSRTREPGWSLGGWVLGGLANLLQALVDAQEDPRPHLPDLQ